MNGIGELQKDQIKQWKSHKALVLLAFSPIFYLQFPYA